jgi:hypothetical protein
MAELRPEYKETWARFKRTWLPVFKTHPIINKSLSVFYWLPIAVVFTKYFYTIKVVTGSSMKVRFLYFNLPSAESFIHPIAPASRHLTQTRHFKETLSSSTAFRHGGIVGSLGETSLHSGAFLFSACLQIAINAFQVSGQPQTVPGEEDTCIRGRHRENFATMPPG